MRQERIGEVRQLLSRMRQYSTRPDVMRLALETAKMTGRTMSEAELGEKILGVLQEDYADLSLVDLDLEAARKAYQAALR